MEKTFVLGSSSGGYVAQQLAMTQPPRVAALVRLGSSLTLLQTQPAFADEVDLPADPTNEVGSARRPLGLTCTNPFPTGM